MCVVELKGAGQKRVGAECLHLQMSGDNTEESSFRGGESYPVGQAGRGGLSVSALRRGSNNDALTAVAADAVRVHICRLSSGRRRFQRPIVAPLQTTHHRTRRYERRAEPPS